MNMMESEGKHLFLFCFLVLILCCAVYVFRSKPAQVVQPIDLEKSRYVLNLSKTHESKAKLVFLDAQGEILQSISYPGMHVNTINFFDHHFYLHAHRLNEHYKLSLDGTLEPFSLTTSAIEETTSGMGSWFATVGQDTLIETMNVGGVDGVYITSLQLQHQNQRLEYIFKDKLPNSALDLGQKVFVQVYDEEKMHHTVIALDKAFPDRQEEVNFEHDFISNKGMLAFKDKILVYGSNKAKKDVEHALEYALALIDPSNLEVKEVIRQERDILFAYVDKNQIKVITTDGFLFVFDENLELFTARPLDVSEFGDVYETYSLRKVIRKGDRLILWSISRAFDPVHLGMIQEFDLDMKLLKQVPVTFKGERTWFGESSDLLVLGD